MLNACMLWIVEKKCFKIRINVQLDKSVKYVLNFNIFNEENGHVHTCAYPKYTYTNVYATSVQARTQTMSKESSN